MSRGTAKNLEIVMGNAKRGQPGQWNHIVFTIPNEFAKAFLDHLNKAWSPQGQFVAQSPYSRYAAAAPAAALGSTSTRSVGSRTGVVLSLNGSNPSKSISMPISKKKTMLERNVDENFEEMEEKYDVNAARAAAAATPQYESPSERLAAMAAWAAAAPSVASLGDLVIDESADGMAEASISNLDAATPRSGAVLTPANLNINSMMVHQMMANAQRLCMNPLASNGTDSVDKMIDLDERFNAITKKVARMSKEKKKQVFECIDTIRREYERYLF